MKYEMIYTQVFDRELNFAQKQNDLSESFRDEWVAVSVAMQSPRFENEELYKEAITKFKYAGSFDEFERVLRKVTLIKKGKRIFLEQKICNNVQKLKLLLDGKIQSADEAREIIDVLLETHDDYGNTIFPSKYMICKMLLCDDSLRYNGKYCIVAKKYMELYCRKTLQRLVNNLIEHTKIGNKVTLTESTEKKLVRDIDFLKKKANGTIAQNNGDINRYVKELEFQVNNLKSALEDAVSNLTELRDTLSQSEEEAKTEATTEFYKQLNAIQYGNILDNCVYAEKVLTEFRHDRIQLDTKVNSLVIVLKQIINFFKSSNIIPILQLDKLGNVIQITDSDTVMYEYKGSSFDKDEIKSVKIVSTGWKYGDESIISYPQVREITEDE